METFAISQVHAGWVTAKLYCEEGCKTVVGSYTPNDAIRDFADAVASLATISSARCSWNQEPGEAKWEFTRTEAVINVAVHSNRQSLECTFPWPRFGADVLNALLMLRSTLGTVTYEREWRYPFPVEACKKLDKALR